VIETTHKILNTDVYRQLLGDITPKEAIKEIRYTINKFIEKRERGQQFLGP